MPKFCDPKIWMLNLEKKLWPKRVSELNPPPGWNFFLTYKWTKKQLPDPLPPGEYFDINYVSCDLNTKYLLIEKQ